MATEVANDANGGLPVAAELALVGPPADRQAAVRWRDTGTA